MWHETKQTTYLVNEDISTISDARDGQRPSHVVGFEDVTIQNEAVVL